MTNLLSSLGDLGIDHLLTGGHNIKLGGQLIDRLTKSFISLHLGYYEAFPETLQVGFGLRGGGGGL